MKWLHEVLLLAVILCHRSLTAADCGYPGAPLSGWVSTKFNGPHSNRWDTYPTGTNVTFQCLDNDLLDGDRSSICQPDGTWSSPVPRCTVKVADEISLSGEGLTSQMDEVRALLDEHSTSCHVLVQSNSSLRLKFDRQPRIYGIRLIPSTPDRRSVAKSGWSLSISDGRSVKIVDVRLVVNDVGLLLLPEIFGDLYWDTLVIRQTKSVKFNMCRLEVHAFSDECGLPDSPLNGQVEVYSNRTASYRCNANYRLNVTSSALRNCSLGVWSGRSPTCYLEASATVDSSTDVTLYYIIIGAVLTLSLFIALYFFKRKRKVSQGSILLMNDAVQLSSSPERGSKTRRPYENLS